MSRRTLLVVSVVVVTLTAAGAAVYRLDLAGVRTATRTEEPTPRAMTAGESFRDRAPAPLGEPALSAATPAPGADRQVSVRYRFDGWAGGPVVDEAGLLPLKPRVAAGGKVTSAPGADGLAVRFPPRCARYGSDDCARAILQSGPAQFLNPGNGSFRYGATIKLAPNETSNGANVLQKGFAVGRSQFKLQVDGSAGRPSCVLVGVSSPSILVAESAVTVADGRWHQIDCARRNGSLTIAVDGRVRGQRSIPPGVSIVNADPLCVGGKGTGANNDQFAGAIDDVYVSISK
jgi:hypothetical protein